MKLFIFSILAVIVYRALEQIDGEKGFKLISYKIAQKIKMNIVQYIT